MRKKAVAALCRYCTPQEEHGRIRCGHCYGYRVPSRREARRRHRGKKAEVEA